MTPDTIDFNSLSKKQLVELVITKYNDCFRLEKENKKLKEELEQLKKQRIFNSAEYDLITLTSTTPQWELRRK